MRTQRNTTCGINRTIIYNNRICMRNVRDSRLAAYGGAVLQRFEFIKVCIGTQRLGLAGKVNSAYILWTKSTYPVAVLYFCRLPAPQADLMRFRTRPHTDFWSARRSRKRIIIPLKISLPTQFLCRSEEEMLKVHVRVRSLHNSAHNAFATIHLFRDSFARNFKYSLVQPQASQTHV